MRIINNGNGTWKFIPGSDSEKASLREVFTQCPIDGRARLKYGGKVADSTGHIDHLLLHAGGQELRVRRGNVISGEYFGSTLLRLYADGDSSSELACIRNVLFFGGGGLSLVSEEISIPDGDGSITVTGGYCKHCSAAINTFCECEWETCNACAAKCAHQYELGAVHSISSPVGVGMGVSCIKCGRGRPKEGTDQALDPNLATENECVAT